MHYNGPLGLDAHTDANLRFLFIILLSSFIN